MSTSSVIVVDQMVIEMETRGPVVKLMVLERAVMVKVALTPDGRDDTIIIPQISIIF